MAALLTSILDKHLQGDGVYCRVQKAGHRRTAPDVNESGAGFTVVGGRIRSGFWP
jgi:DNA polymerase III alpha subunit